MIDPAALLIVISRLGSALAQVEQERDQALRELAELTKEPTRRGDS